MTEKSFKLNDGAKIRSYDELQNFVREACEQIREAILDKYDELENSVVTLELTVKSNPVKKGLTEYDPIETDCG